MLLASAFGCVWSVKESIIIELAIKNPAPPQMDAVIVSLDLASMEQYAMTSSMAPTVQAMAHGKTIRSRVDCNVIVR